MTLSWVQLAMTLLSEEKAMTTLVGDIFGGTGNDSLSGGAGDDILTEA
jgi:Ca2+-binding RTX toxin-like protein